MGYAMNGASYKSSLYFVISVLSHNSTGLIGPLVLFLNNNRIMKIFACLGAILVPFAMYIINQLGKNYNFQQLNQLEVGAIIDIIYFLFFVFVLLVTYLSAYLKPEKDDNIILIITAYFCLLSLASLAIFSSSNSERMGMLMAGILYPFLFILLEQKFAPKIPNRLILFLISTLPLVLVYKQI
tara:strand:- start:108 stop:656 length:549 start_codon:yes stop_codon:yes gene_type:complete